MNEPKPAVSKEAALRLVGEGAVVEDRCGVLPFAPRAVRGVTPQSNRPFVPYPTTQPLSHNSPMKKFTVRNLRNLASAREALSALALAALALTQNAQADETCSSPYLARIEGQEEFVYVWTLGVEGLGDGSDKLVVVDVKP